MARSMETVVTKVVDPHEESATEGEACLVVIYGEPLGRRYFLPPGEQVIGRSESAAIQVDQESISRQHARLRTQAGSSWVVDLQSTNGTYVNNARILQENMLRDGDLLRVGQTIFKYLSGNNIERKYHEEIYRMSTVDGLTEVYNKRIFLDTLDREIDRSVRYGRGLTLVLMDIDHFKKINDTHGHLAGDHVLREVAYLLSNNLRKQDFVARYGGEEFALLLPEINFDDAQLVCEKLRILIQDQRIVDNGHQIQVTASFGIAYYDGGKKVPEGRTLIQLADSNLYNAKQQGRNLVKMSLYEPELSNPSSSS